MGSLDIDPAIIVEEEARINSMKVERNWVAPIVGPNIVASDVEVFKLSIEDVRANYIELALVVPNSGGIETSNRYQSPIRDCY